MADTIPRAETNAFNHKVPINSWTHILTILVTREVPISGLWLPGKEDCLICCMREWFVIYWLIIGENDKHPELLVTDNIVGEWW